MNVISELHILYMQDHSVQYNTRSLTAAAAESTDPGHCSVMEQKQTQSGFKDEPCGKLVPDDFAGLCEYVAPLLSAFCLSNSLC